MTARLSERARHALASEIAEAGGREVSFVGTVDTDGSVVDVRVAARGTVDAVLALPGVAGRGDLFIHNHPSGNLEPSVADLNVAARLHNGGAGFAIVSNDATEMYVVVEVPRPRGTTRIDPVEIAGMLGEGGLVASALSAFENRQSQRDMTAYVVDTYVDGGIALLEAGTGVGKSFAYLLPALEWARANDERSVVSTNTINLQEQLVGKDLPVLRRALTRDGREPRFALLKGWRNYLCLFRLEHARAAQASLLESARSDQLDHLAAWAQRTADGTLSDLTDPPDAEVWDEVAAESDLCLRMDCPHFDRCFLFSARRAAAEADVVVVNHHLLASDVAVRAATENWQEAAVLPPYRRLIIDEAQHFEDTMAQHLGAHVSSTGVRRLLNRLERNGRGLLPALTAHLARRDDLLGSASRDLVDQRVLPAVRDARRYAEEVFEALHHRLHAANESVYRLTEAFAEDAIWTSGLGPTLDNLVSSLHAVRDGVETLAERVGLGESTDVKTRMLVELRAVIRRLQSAQDGLMGTLRPPEWSSGTVRWLERRGARGTAVALASVPLDLGPLLKDAMFDRIESVVLTSATLATDGSFGFLEERLGLSLPPSRVTTRQILSSPFDYGSQSVFAVPTDIADPGAPGPHDECVIRAVVELAEVADGGMFVLFTSHAQLRRVAEALPPKLKPRWPLLVQGDAPRDVLLRRFRDSGMAILLGTDSFWEGVDVPGPALRVLIVAKLPFRVPTEPLTAARIARLVEQGEDGFRGYLLPLATLKLKQGFGRLIRSHHDLGVVVLLDRRITTRPYGVSMMESLPPAMRVIGPWTRILAAAEEFFAQYGIGGKV